MTERQYQTSLANARRRHRRALAEGVAPALTQGELQRGAVGRLMRRAARGAGDAAALERAWRRVCPASWLDATRVVPMTEERVLVLVAEAEALIRLRQSRHALASQLSLAGVRCRELVVQRSRDVRPPVAARAELAAPRQTKHPTDETWVIEAVDDV